MAYTEEQLVRYLYPEESLQKMMWMVENLACYAPQQSDYLGWQVTLRNRHFIKKANGWIEVDKCGKIVLQQMVA
jgi:hypothetical protein